MGYLYYLLLNFESGYLDNLLDSVAMRRSINHRGKDCDVVVAACFVRPASEQCKLYSLDQQQYRMYSVVAMSFLFRTPCVMLSRRDMFQISIVSH